MTTYIIYFQYKGQTLIADKVRVDTLLEAVIHRDKLRKIYFFANKDFSIDSEEVFLEKKLLI